MQVICVNRGMAKAVPNAILKKRGSKKSRRYEPVLEGGIGAPIRPLSGVALATWNEVSEELAAVGIGSRVESAALTCYCEAVADFVMACDEIDRLGMVTQTERGYTRNPACLIKNASMQMIAKFAGEFGLTPSSRSKLQVAPKNEDNEYDKF